MGRDGNYWGHNAIIRTRAFADHCGMPDLPGKAPFGGLILSHDFVEAALIRRAGWSVYMLPTLGGSYEESPPSLIDLAARDRRDSERAAAPLMVALGAKVINNSRLTSEETTALILNEVRKKLAEMPSRPPR